MSSTTLIPEPHKDHRAYRYINGVIQADGFGKKKAKVKKPEVKKVRGFKLRPKPSESE